MQKIEIRTSGERFYPFTDEVLQTIQAGGYQSGILHLFCLHTSCALAISESYDPTAKSDLEQFLKALAPRNQSFIQHTLEGDDDSPSHMKSLLLQPSLQLIVEGGELVLGRWQGIYLAEFRDHPHKRTIAVKFMADE